SFNWSAVTIPSSKFAFTLLELNNTFTSSTPFSLFIAFSIRLMQDGQLNVSNCNSIFFIFISPLICSTFSINGCAFPYLDVGQNFKKKYSFSPTRSKLQVSVDNVSGIGKSKRMKE